MNVFNKYAAYYDLIYRDRDYTSEVMYIDKLIQTYKQGAKALLELGCGTGFHACELVKKGYSIYGIDISEEMLNYARTKASTIPAEEASRLTYAQGDIRDFEVAKKFDAVIALFHVLSYQNTDRDLKEVFKKVNVHLSPGGLFLFDCWYGPAVLAQKPSRRVKHMENDDFLVTRIAEPVMHEEKNIVHVNYQISVKNKETGRVEKFHEKHSMRYLFSPEVNNLFKEFGMEPILSEEWLSGKKPGTDTWGVCFGGIKRG